MDFWEFESDFARTVLVHVAPGMAEDVLRDGSLLFVVPAFTGVFGYCLLDDLEMCASGVV